MSNPLSIDLADDDLGAGAHCIGTTFHDQGIYNGI